MAAAGIGAILIAFGLILLLAGVSQTAGIILLIIGALALVLGFTAFGGIGSPRDEDVLVVRDRPLRRRRRVIREERDLY